MSVHFHFPRLIVHICSFNKYLLSVCHAHARCWRRRETQTVNKWTTKASKRTRLLFLPPEIYWDLLPVWSTTEAMWSGGWELCTWNQTDLCSNFCYYYLKMGITLPNLYGFRVNLMRQSINNQHVTCTKNVQQMVPFILLFNFNHPLLGQPMISHYTDKVMHSVEKRGSKVYKRSV